MHDTAGFNAKLFFDCYGAALQTRRQVKVVDIGSQDVNGSLRAFCPPAFTYIGVDLAPGKNVDIVLGDAYKLPFEDQSVDVVLSSSCFEHVEMFWVLFLEVLRILKPDGLFYLNVPSNGAFHRFSLDCWRFYPDSGGALITWAKRNGLNPHLLESYTGMQSEDIWNDYVAIFLKDRGSLGEYPQRILDTFDRYTNGSKDGGEMLKFSLLTEDQQKLKIINQVVNQMTVRKLRS